MSTWSVDVFALCFSCFVLLSCKSLWLDKWLKAVLNVLTYRKRLFGLLGFSVFVSKVFSVYVSMLVFFWVYCRLFLYWPHFLTLGYFLRQKSSSIFSTFCGFIKSSFIIDTFLVKKNLLVFAVSEYPTIFFNRFLSSFCRSKRFSRKNVLSPNVPTCLRLSYNL